MQILKNIFLRYKKHFILGLLAAVQIAVLASLFLTWPVNLSLLVLDTEGKYWEPLVQEFQRKHPLITIHLRLVETTDDIETIYTEDFRRASPFYDLVYMDIIWLPKFAEEGQLRELDDRITPAELEKEFLNKEVALGQYENHLYRIPFRSDAGVLFYRKDLLKHAGKQELKTFPDVLEAAQKLKEKKVEPSQYVWQGREYEGLVATFYEVLRGYGGSWIDGNDVGLDRQEAIDAVRFLSNAIADEVSPSVIRSYTEDDTSNDFVESRAAFLRGWPDTWDRVNKSAVREKVELISMGTNKEDKIVSCLGGWGFGITKKARHPKEAWLAIEFFTSEAVQRRFVMASSYLPSRKKLFSDPQIIEKYPHFKDKKMLHIVEEAVARPPIPQYEEASKILQGYLRQALFNGLTPEDAMRGAAKETRDLLAKKKSN